MARTIKNILTGNVIQIPDPNGVEVEYDGKVMITETDTAGIITYANRKFIEMTGYTKEETIGAPHNINRHPIMPKAAFQEMWKTIKSGKYWEGYVRNLNQNGKHYDVIVWIKPRFDENEKIVGYIAGRKIADKEAMELALEKYSNMVEE